MCKSEVKSSTPSPKRNQAGSVGCMNTKERIVGTTDRVKNYGSDRDKTRSFCSVQPFRVVIAYIIIHIFLFGESDNLLHSAKPGGRAFPIS